MRDVCLCMQVDALVCSEIERENTPRCTRYAFQWAGYQRRIHPTFPCWNASVLFSPSLSLSFSPPLSLSRLSLGRGLLRLVHTCSTLKNAAPTQGNAFVRTSCILCRQNAQKRETRFTFFCTQWFSSSMRREKR